MNEYLKQAEDFLANTDTTLTVTYLRTGKYFKEDKEERDIYNFVLSNSKGSYSHEFGDSIKNTEIRKLSAQPKGWNNDKLNLKIQKAKIAYKNRPKPNSYDILAGLSMYVEPLFEDFINEFGYNDAPVIDYPILRELHDDCLRQQKALHRMFTAEQLEQLQEIN